MSLRLEQKKGDILVIQVTKRHLNVLYAYTAKIRMLNLRKAHIEQTYFERFELKRRVLKLKIRVTKLVARVMILT